MIRAHEESDTKSKRVTASIERLCKGWLAGTYRGVIRNGKDPLWVRRNDDGWELVPERVEAARTALDLYRRGYSATRILEALADRQLSLTGNGPQSLQIYRLIRQRTLLGEKELEIGGETYRLPDYYPALLTPAEWADLQAIADIPLPGRSSSGIKCSPGIRRGRSWILQASTSTRSWRKRSEPWRATTAPPNWRRPKRQ